RRRGARSRDRLLPQPRAALRPHQRASRRRRTRRGRLSGVLAARLGTAAVLIAALIGALFFLPPRLLGLLVAALITGGAFEWARLCRLARAAAWGYAALIAGVFIVLWNYRFDPAAFIAAGAFWIVVVPLWLAFGVRATHRAALLASGFLVLVPAGVAMATIGGASVLMVLI